MMFKLLVSTFLVAAISSVLIHCAPSHQRIADSASKELDASETTTPMPPVYMTNKTLLEMSIAVQNCWGDANIGHGPHSADPWMFGEDASKPRKTSAEECAEITTYFEYCLFISVFKAQEKTMVMRYHPRVDSEVSYVVSKKNGL